MNPFILIFGGALALITGIDNLINSKKVGTNIDTKAKTVPKSNLQEEINPEPAISEPEPESEPNHEQEGDSPDNCS